MKTVSIQLPAKLFTDLYLKFGEDTEEKIVDCLSSLSEDEKARPSTGKSPFQHFMRPGEGTITGRVWEIADQQLENDGTSDRTAVVQACIEEGINMNTANTQYSHWKKALAESGDQK